MYGLPAMLPWSLLRFFATLYTLATLYYLDGYGRFKMGGYAEEYFVRPPDFNDYEWKQIEKSRSMARRVELFQFYRNLHERERMKRQIKHLILFSWFAFEKILSDNIKKF